MDWFYLSALFPSSAAEVKFFILSSCNCLTKLTLQLFFFSPSCLCFSPLQGCTTGISCWLRWVESPPWCFVPKYAGEGNKKWLMGQQEKATKGRVWPAGQTGSLTFFYPGSAPHILKPASRLAGRRGSDPWITYWVTAQACEKIMADVVVWSHVRMWIRIKKADMESLSPQWILCAVCQPLLQPFRIVFRGFVKHHEWLFIWEGAPQTLSLSFHFTPQPPWKSL